MLISRSATTAFVFYCDAKHSDNLQWSSRVRRYLFTWVMEEKRQLTISLTSKVLYFSRQNYIFLTKGPPEPKKLTRENLKSFYHKLISRPLRKIVPDWFQTFKLLIDTPVEIRLYLVLQMFVCQRYYKSALSWSIKKKMF